jgi:hypothetical protein
MGNWNQPASVCIDGMSVAEFERRSAAKAGLTVDQWRQTVIAALKKAKPGESTGIGSKYPEAVQRLDSPAPANKSRILRASELNAAGEALQANPAGLPSLMSGTLGNAQFGPQAGGGKDNYMSHRWPMWQYLSSKGVAVFDPAWQPELAVSFVGADGKPTFAGDVPYVATRPGFSPPKGSFVHVTMTNAKDYDPGGFYKPIYARVLEAGPSTGAEVNKAELSTSGFAGMGAPNVDPTKGVIPIRDRSGNTKPRADGSGPKSFNPDLSFQTLGDQRASWLDRSAGGNLDFNETQQAGWLVHHGKAGVIKNRQQLQDALKKLSPEDRASLDKGTVTMPEPKTAGGQKLTQGFPTVALGKELHRAGYAAPACVHEGGGAVKEGALGVYLAEYPFARVGDGTTDDLSILNGADELHQSVYVGGTSTTQTLKPPPRKMPAPRPLRPGAKGPQVKALQQRLQKLGYEVAADGIYGPQTEAAVKRFQNRSALASDGIAGARTLGAMG